MCLAQGHILAPSKDWTPDLAPESDAWPLGHHAPTNLKFHRNHSYFRKCFQMLYAVYIGHTYPPNCALGHSYQHQSSKTKTILHYHDYVGLDPGLRRMRVPWFFCWTSRSTIFQSWDGSNLGIYQYFGSLKCLAQGHYTAVVGFKPRTFRSEVWRFTTWVTAPQKWMGVQMCKRIFICCSYKHLLKIIYENEFSVILWILRRPVCNSFKFFYNCVNCDFHHLPY